MTPAQECRKGADRPTEQGQVSPVLERKVTQAIIDRYAAATGDFNPIHVDADYSAKGPFGRTIAHGLMTLAFAAEMLNGWTDGGFDRSGEIEVSFTSPVFVDETIRIQAVVDQVDAAGTAHCTLDCTAGGRKILVGSVRLSTGT